MKHTDNNDRNVVNEARAHARTHARTHTHTHTHTYIPNTQRKITLERVGYFENK